MTARKITYSSHPNHAARLAHAKGERQFRTYDTSHIRPKKSKIPILSASILAIIVFLLVFWGGSALLKSCGNPALQEGDEVEISIPDGSGAKDIGTILQTEGVIANSNDFVKRVADLGVASELKPGFYLFKGGMTLDQVIGLLRVGPEANYETFTIPEGWTLAQTAARIEEETEGRIPAEEFLALAKDASLYASDYPFLSGAYNNSLEGFLFPKTYPLKGNATADSIIRMMLSQYQTETAMVDFAFSGEHGLSRYEVLVIASLIEREAALAEERGLVSSVIYNRLEEGMLLQIDAAVAYAAGVVDVTPEHLAIDSPFNTYQNQGLPPGPICSPGLASIQAAANPELTEYYYYVTKHEGDRSHFFSTTYEEHEAYINKD
ncbi:MAG: endolytic transglycosylase MltG [Eggerthellaceae bacterium]|nr:endolytic transglycosylase MltG [Eggerthellaceae bacterium]